MNFVKRGALYLARKKYCKTAIEDHADLKAIREKPTVSMIVGLILIGLSYTIGMPTVVAFGIWAAAMGNPLLGIVGGAAIYAISTIMFIIGIKMAGKKYFQVFCRWAVRVVLEKILGDDMKMISEPGSDDKCL